MAGKLVHKRSGHAYFILRYGLHSLRNPVSDVGFTGTEEGMNERQIRDCYDVLRFLYEERNARRFHHGDCIGADQQAFVIAKSIGYETHSHPPENPKARAFTKSDINYPVLPYMARNDEIVAASDVLIAGPYQDGEIVRSGTWATIRRAIKAYIPIVQLHRGKD